MSFGKLSSKSHKMFPHKDREIKITYIIFLQLALGIIVVSVSASAETFTEQFDFCSTLVHNKQCHCYSENHSGLPPELVTSFIQCSSAKLKIFFKQIHIECGSQTEYVLNLIPNINNNFAEIEIDSCKLLDFRNILQKFNTTELRAVEVKNCGLENELLPEPGTFFGEINTLETLTITNLSKKNSDDFVKYFPNLMRYFSENNPKLEDLQLSNNHLEKLPDNVFKKNGILRFLDLSRNNLTRITNKSFTGLIHLNQLDLGINSIRHIEENAFSDLVDLIAINLKSNDLGTISSNIFKNNRPLEKVWIDWNPQIIFSDYVFAILKNLEKIDMSNNQIEKIFEHTFENCTKLTTLEMQNNNLKELPINLFKTLKKLISLNLSNNKLGFVPAGIFSYMENLEELNLEGNSIADFFLLSRESLKNLEVLNLKRNKMEYFEINDSRFLRKLTKLDLSYNQLKSSFDFLFNWLPEAIEQINLSHNNISSFSTGVYGFRYAKNVIEIDLSYNSLSEIYEPYLKMPSHYNVNINLTHNQISHIDLDTSYEQEMANKNPNHRTTLADINDNPLICDCSNYELFEYLRGTHSDRASTIIFKMNNVKCFEPKQKEYILIGDRSLQQITCEDFNNCPSKCTCFRRPYNKAFLFDCSFVKLDNPPTLTTAHQRLEIILVGNNLRRGPREGEGYENVTTLNLSENELIFFDWCPPNIEKLNLSHNNLKLLSSKVLEVLNSSSKFTELTLGQNPWTCDCSALELRNFIQTHVQKIDTNNVLCENDKTAIFKRNDLCKPKFTIASLMLLIFLLISTVSTVFAFYFKYRQEIKIWLFSKNCCLWFVIEEELDKDKIYDIFLCFSHKDEDFVMESLVPPLEKSFKLCIHSRDWVPGELINHQIVYSVYNSRRTVVVLSNDFLESAWGKLEFLIAHKQSLEEGRPRVVVIKLGDLNGDKLDAYFKAYMKTNTYVEWGEPWFWKKLIYSVPHSRNYIAKINQQDADLIGDFECEELHIK